MNKNSEKRKGTFPEIVPLGGDTYKISYPQEFYCDIKFARNLPDIPERADIYELNGRLNKNPYNFEIAFILSEILTETGGIDTACNIRFEAANRIIDLLPEDEEVELSWNIKDNQTLIFLLNYSAVDNFLIRNFEVAAALLETCMDIDPEDHLDCSKLLAYCYIAMDDQELYREEILNLDFKDPEKNLIELFASWRFEGILEKRLLKEFSTSALFKEFIAEVHEVDENYLAEIDSGRPSREIRARQIFLKTEPPWEQFGSFIDALKASV